MIFDGPKTFFAAASTGTGTGTAVTLDVPGTNANDIDKVAIQFQVEAVGATPTITYQIEASIDGTNFFKIGYTTEATDTLAVTAVTTTATGYAFYYVDTAKRPVQSMRINVTANTNVTFNAKAWLVRQED